MSDSSAGQIVGGIVGATIGFFTGGVQGAFIGFNLGYTAGGIIDPPPGPSVEGPRLDDLKVQSSHYGAPLPIIYGRARVAGNVIWIQDNKLIERRVVTEQGGKGGGGGSSEVVTYEYYATFAVSVCEGPVTGIRRIWADNVLIYDAGDDVTPTGALGTLQVSNQITVYTGTTTQEPNELIEADRTTAPAFRGTCYVVFDRLHLKKYGNRIPNMSFEVVDGSAGVTQIASYTFDFDPQAQYPLGATQSPLLIDKAGRACIFRVGWTSGGSENTTHYPTVIYPDGTYVEGTSFDIGGRDYFGTNLPSMDESDKFTVARAVASGGSASSFRVAEYDPINDSVTTTYFSTSTSVGIFNGDNHYTLRNNRITFYNQLSDDLAVANYPGGSASNPLEMQILLNSDDTTGTIFAHTHDGSTCYALTDSNILYLVDMDTRAVSSSVTLGRAFSQLRYDDLWGKLYGLVTTTDIYEIDPTDGSDTLILSSSGIEAFTVRGDLIQAHNNSQSAFNTKWWRINAVGASDVTLSSILSDLSTRSGLAAADIDVSGIADTVAGFVHTKPGAALDDMRTLALSYHFDLVESAHQVKFVSRGGSSAVTLDNDDLAAHEYGQERPDELVLIREREVRIPRRVEVSFIDSSRDFDPGQQYAERTEVDSEHIGRMSLAVLLTTDQAARIAEVLLWRAWLERESFEFALPPQYSYLEPTDLVTLDLTEGTYTVRLVDVSHGEPGLVRCRGVAELPDIYTSLALGGVVDAAAAQVPLVTDTRLRLLDMPLLRDRDDDSGFYVAAGGQYGTSWEGALLFQSNDDGETYYRVDAILEQSTMGLTTDALAIGETTVIDRVNTVNVRLYNAATLSSITELAMLNGGNLAVIGADGRWEVVKFQNATLQADGSYTLDTLIRGYRGTEWAMGLHQVGDKFVLLSEATTQRYDPGSDLIGLARDYKAPTFGQNIIEAANQAFTNNAVGLKPYAPVHIKGTRNGSGDLTITWVRRTRIGGEWRDYVDAPLGEESESYEVDILGSGSPDNVLRTLTSTSETATYTAAQQVTDFGATQSVIEVNVYQLSATVGRGYSGNAAI